MPSSFCGGNFTPFKWASFCALGSTAATSNWSVGSYCLVSLELHLYAAVTFVSRRCVFFVYCLFG